MPGAQDAGAAPAEHTVLWFSKHTMPSPQSASVLHGPGTHSLITTGSQGGGAGQVSPGAQAGVAQPVPPTAWHARPFAQSASVVHSARAPAETRVTAEAASAAR